MMQSQLQPQTNVSRLQDQMVDLVYSFCSIFTFPVEMVIRPQYGSRYFQPVTMFLSAVLMIVLPVLFAITSAVSGLLPFAKPTVTFGLIGIWGFSKLFFIGSIVHGVRIFRRMINMSRELSGVWEGPPLPFFTWLPGASHWKIRLIFEPIAVFAAALLLQNFLLLESSAAHFLMFVSVCLVFKSYTAWFVQWEHLRILMDIKFAGPIIAKLADNTATDDELASIHIASFPDGLPPDMRHAAVTDIAQAYSAQIPKR